MQSLPRLLLNALWLGTALLACQSSHARGRLAVLEAQQGVAVSDSCSTCTNSANWDDIIGMCGHIVEDTRRYNMFFKHKDGNAHDFMKCGCCMGPWATYGPWSGNWKLAETDMFSHVVCFYRTTSAESDASMKEWFFNTPLNCL